MGCSERENTLDFPKLPRSNIYRSKKATHIDSGSKTTPSMLAKAASKTVDLSWRAKESSKMEIKPTHTMDTGSKIRKMGKEWKL